MFITTCLPDNNVANSELRRAEELGLKEGKIITLKDDKSEIIDGIKIHYVPLWKWLLNLN